MSVWLEISNNPFIVLEKRIVLYSNKNTSNIKRDMEENSLV